MHGSQSETPLVNISGLARGPAPPEKKKRERKKRKKREKKKKGIKRGIGRELHVHAVSKSVI